MATLKKYSLEGKHLGDIDVASKLADAEANGQMIKDYIVALRANARQWSAHTKTRSEVKHTTKKPHPQKGGGRARQGSLVSPQYRGGGRVFGPRAKFDQHVRINRKERRAAIRCLIGEKIREGKMIVIENTDMEAPKTKSIINFMSASSVQGRVLFLGGSNIARVEEEDFQAHFHLPCHDHENFIKSMRNIPKTSFSLAGNISGYDIVVAHHLVVTESALQELQEWLC